MSAQFGKCNFDGEPVGAEVLDRMRPVLAPYGPDDEGCYRKGNLGVLYRAFHTTKESRKERQPQVSGLGAVITWDGRLDNREHLLSQLDCELSPAATDVEIVAAGYDRWSSDCFPKLVGDWTVSIWDSRKRSLLLARDTIGVRPLFYSFENEHLTWCTILDSFLLFGRGGCRLDQEYVAGWLSFFPATHLTPYSNIHSVPPACFVCLSKEGMKTVRYWEFNPDRKLHYGTDAEYEEHFRFVFAEAVRRRLHADTPIMAELSGGMDSSSIVCVADDVMTRGLSDAPRLDTVSYYDDSEPNWNERPFFTKVEGRRRRTGRHIDVSKRAPFRVDLKREGLTATPGSHEIQDDAEREFSELLRSGGNRVVLTGIGGDEFTGGVPTPIPELANLLSRFRVKALAHQLRTWALNKRRPWFHLLLEVIRQFLPPTLVGVPSYRRPAPWLNHRFVRQHSAALSGYSSRLNIFGPRPSFQESVSTLDEVRRQLQCSPLPCAPTYEKRFPYLDRDLLEFLFAIDREQLVRPGQRRSLMRRALADVVPDEILNRKRKAYVARAPMAALSTMADDLADLAEHMVSAELEIVDQRLVAESIHMARNGRDIPMIALARTLELEYWLRNLKRQGMLNTSLRITRNPVALSAIRKPDLSILDIHQGSERR